MIHQLSYPDNQSINHSIPSEESLVQYSFVADAITFIHQCGSMHSAAKLINSLLSSSFSVQLGFRLLLMWHLFAIWTSCRIFERFFKTALLWTARNKLWTSFISHVLDDFIIVNNSAMECIHQLSFLRWYGTPCNIFNDDRILKND